MNRRKFLKSGLVIAGLAVVPTGLSLAGNEPWFHSDYGTLNKANTRKLLNDIKVDVGTIIKSYSFEIHNDLTRANVKSSISLLLQEYQNKAQIYEYSVICDRVNNYPERIDKGELHFEYYVTIYGTRYGYHGKLLNEGVPFSHVAGFKREHIKRI